MNVINGSRRFDSVAKQFLSEKSGNATAVEETSSQSQAMRRSMNPAPLMAHVAKRASNVQPVTPQQQAIEKIQSDFKQRFSAAAADKQKFHAMMKECFGAAYDYAKAESFRQRALKGDYNWLPPIEFVSKETLGGGNGAYDAGRNVVYLNEEFVSNVDRGAEIYSEEVGHFLDTRLNTSDAVGDEGEMFRHLLRGDQLSAAQKAAIRSENDHGVIYVNGKATDVEFSFLGDAWNKVKKVASDAVDAGKKVVSGAADAGRKFIDDAWAAVRNAGSKGAKAVGKAVAGGAKTLVGAVKGAAKATGKFVSNAASSTAEAVKGGVKWLGNAVGTGVTWTVGALKDAGKAVGNGILTAGKWLGGAAKDAWNWFTPRLVDAGEGLWTGLRDGLSGALRNMLEGGDKFIKGVGEIFKGHFGDGFRDMGLGLLKTFVQTPIDFHMMVGGRAVSAIQTLIGVEPAGRKLRDDEITELKKVYGDSIDYSRVRIKESDDLFTVGGAARTHGDVIHIPKGKLSKSLLVHEMAHVWQFQHGGTDYMSEALIGQTAGEKYDYTKGIREGKSWSELNPEQQGDLLRDAYDQGYFNPTADGSAPTFTSPKDMQDHTAYLQQALVQVRNRAGAA
jgi:hypothetical protein